MVAFAAGLSFCVKFAPIDITENPVAIVAGYLVIFFGLEIVWFTELIEMVTNTSVPNGVLSTLKDFSGTRQRLIPTLPYVLMIGLCPIYLYCILSGRLCDSWLAVFGGLVGIGILAHAPRLAHSWAVADSLKSPNQPLNQSNVLARYFSLSSTGIVFIVISTIWMVVHAYLHATLEIFSNDMEIVKNDIEKFVLSGEYMNAVKLIRQSSVGNAVLMSFLPSRQSVAYVTDGLIWVTMVIYCVQAITAVSIRRLKLEIRKFI
jgi:hypothetical protein